ncbi:MAG: TatD family hydrolase [Candidatus Thorarchaeota archaeon]
MTEPRYVDSHCHLETKEFDSDRDSIIETARELDISIITSGIEKASWNKACKIAEKYKNVYASVGLNPTQYDICPQAIDWIESNSDRFISIGETGLDHYLVRDHEERKKQRACFEKLVGLADLMKIPIQVHSRSAGKKALEILEENNARDVHLHAFDGKASLARVASRDLGYYFSIPTSVVRSPQKQKLVKAVAIERLLIETDSPVLAPERGERNVPSNLPLVVREISRLLRRDEEEVREITLENTLRLYSKIRTH